MHFSGSMTLGRTAVKRKLAIKSLAVAERCVARYFLHIQNVATPSAATPSDSIELPRTLPKKKYLLQKEIRTSELSIRSLFSLSRVAQGDDTVRDIFIVGLCKRGHEPPVEHNASLCFHQLCGSYPFQQIPLITMKVQRIS